MSQANASQKSGLPVIAWVGIGCLGIVVIGAVIAFAGGWFLVGKAKEMAKKDPSKLAEFAVKANPDLDFVSNDKKAGTFTVKNTKTGEIIVWNYDDIKSGRFSVTGANGDITVDAANAGSEGITIQSEKDGVIQIGGAAGVENIPSWVPVYPNVTSTTSNMSRRQGNSESGAITLVTSDDPGTVAAHYRQEFEDAGFEVTEPTANVGNSAGPQSLSAKADGRTVQVTVIATGGKTNIVVNYHSE